MYLLHKNKVAATEVLGFVVKFSYSTQASGPTAEEIKQEKARKLQEEAERLEEKRQQEAKM